MTATSENIEKLDVMPARPHDSLAKRVALSVIRNSRIGFQTLPPIALAILLLHPGQGEAGCLTRPERQIFENVSNLNKFLPECKFDFFFRYRSEWVNDDGQDHEQPLRDAQADTVRTALGWDSGTIWGSGFAVFGQIESVKSLSSDYFDGRSRREFAEVIDPDGFEWKQYNARFDGRTTWADKIPILRDSIVRFGRQEITHRADPFQRFVGNVGFRQHFQVYDGVRMTNKSIADLNVDYAYIWNVKTVFGSLNRRQGDRHLDGHLINLVYDGDLLRSHGRQWGKLETYGYLLDFHDPEDKAFPSQTYGARLETAYPLPGGLSFLGLDNLLELRGKVEYARQSDYGVNPNRFAHDYFSGELGATYFTRPARESWAAATAMESTSLLFDYELLGGDGSSTKDDKSAAFQTPLGTNHAFQGFADRFLNTPADGIHDLFVTLKSTFRPWNAKLDLQLIYHDFQADAADYYYGSEWNVVAEFSPLTQGSAPGEWFRDKLPNVLQDPELSKNLLIGLQYAAYQADRNTQNKDNNHKANLDADTQKIWTYVQWKY